VGEAFRRRHAAQLACSISVLSIEELVLPPRECVFDLRKKVTVHYLQAYSEVCISVFRPWSGDHFEGERVWTPFPLWKAIGTNVNGVPLSKCLRTHCEPFSG